MTALDALPAPKHNQPSLPFTDVGEYLHCCELFTVGSKKAYMEVRFRIFCASTAEFSFKLENKEANASVEVYARGGVRDSRRRSLLRQLYVTTTRDDDYKRKLFTSTINAGKLNKVFHGASRLKRAMMAVDISSYAEEEPTDSNKVCEDEEELALTGRDMGRMFFLPMPGDQEWEKGYVGEYLRPCLPVEVPTKEDSAGRKVDSSFLADYNVNNSANWRSHKQANVCLDNFLQAPRKRKQTSSVPVAEAKSMLGSSNVVPVSSMRMPVDKCQWHVVHFWDWDFRLETEIFDDGVRQQHNGKRFAQESWDRVLSFAKRYNKSISYDCV
eukprot:g71399.t1